MFTLVEEVLAKGFADGFSTPCLAQRSRGWTPSRRGRGRDIEVVVEA